MAEMHEAAGPGELMGLNRSSLAVGLRPAPPRFTLASFGARLRQHLIVYGALLVTAIYACAFIFAPLETSMISEVLVAVAVCIAIVFSPSRQRLRRLVEGGLAAGYIIGAAVLLKAFDAFFRI